MSNIREYLACEATLGNIVGEHMMPHSLKSKNAAVIQTTFIISTSDAGLTLIIISTANSTS